MFDKPKISCQKFKCLLDSPKPNLDFHQLDDNLTKAVKSSSELTRNNEKSACFERKDEVEIVVRWSNIEVTTQTKKILDNISGQATNLEIVAILGPSGAGKSTLLNTIAGRTANYKGSVKFYSNEERIGFAYVQQVDQLSPYLTVRESLLYASKFKNSEMTNHQEEVDSVIDSFNLNSVENHFTTRCSGGERKRLSIALEMISKPKILLLDEPTTGRDPSLSNASRSKTSNLSIFLGLDSTTAFVIIETLKVSLE